MPIFEQPAATSTKRAKTRTERGKAPSPSSHHHPCSPPPPHVRGDQAVPETTITAATNTTFPDLTYVGTDVQTSPCIVYSPHSVVSFPSLILFFFFPAVSFCALYPCAVKICVWISSLFFPFFFRHTHHTYCHLL